jgi:hypothetical protein
LLNVEFLSLQEIFKSRRKDYGDIGAGTGQHLLEVLQIAFEERQAGGKCLVVFPKDSGLELPPDTRKSILVGITRRVKDGIENGLQAAQDRVCFGDGNVDYLFAEIGRLDYSTNHSQLGADQAQLVDHLGDLQGHGCLRRGIVPVEIIQHIGGFAANRAVIFMCLFTFSLMTMSCCTHICSQGRSLQ